MEGRKLGFRTAANDNFKEGQRLRIAETVPILDTVRLGALRQKVSEVLATFPFLVGNEKIEEAMDVISGMTRYDVIRIINSTNPHTLDDTKAHFYQALLNTLDEEVIEE